MELVWESVIRKLVIGKLAVENFRDTLLGSFWLCHSEWRSWLSSGKRIETKRHEESLNFQILMML